MNIFSKQTVPSISAEELKRALEEKEDITVIDVRTPEEFSRGKIRGSINIPVDTITADIGSSIPNKQEKIYVYCLSGSRSIYAVDAMMKLGYTNVYDVSHGLLAWRIKGYPVLQ